jgi:hypothetical protein
LSNKITFSLDEINVLGNQGAVAMSLQQFHTVDMLHYDKQEKEVRCQPQFAALNLTSHPERAENKS